MIDIIVLGVAISIILILHIIVEFKDSGNIWLNRAIIIDCVICLIYLLIWLIWK